MGLMIEFEPPTCFPIYVHIINRPGNYAEDVLSDFNSVTNHNIGKTIPMKSTTEKFTVSIDLKI
jgi:hypothetical protein